MIYKILKNKVFEKKPPVLIDVGASDEINSSWKKISKYSICLGFDTNIQNNKNDNSYKKFYLIQSLISNKNEKNFYFTFDKNCSSSLKPINKDIKKYLFNKKFVIKKTKKLKYITLNSVLKNYKISYIDWFKTDTQGTDLRIFKSLNQNIKKKILIAEFEPGFENVYTNEDTVADVVKYMIKDFFIDSFKVKGDYYFNKKKTKLKFLNKLQNRFFHLFNKKQIVWANITFINKLKSKFSKRDILLYIVIQILRKNYLIALKICEQKKKIIGDELYNYIIINIKKEIQNKTFYLFIHLFKIIIKKFVRILKF